MTFARAADFDDPVQLRVDQLRRGRTFSSLAVQSEQRGKLVAPSLLLMDGGAPDVMRAAAAAPDVPGPEDAEPYDMGVAGRDLRIVDGAYSPDPDRVGPPEINAWMRFRDNPGEVCLRQALVAQATTHWTIAAAMRPHRGFGEAQAHDSLSTGPVAVAISFHDDAPLDEWFLYSTTAIWSGQGLVQGEGRVFTSGGVLLASYSLQAMVRGRLASAGGRDAATAM
jgi:acyl-CoA thioesterase